MTLAMKARRAERGLGLLEISIALALAAVIIAGISIYLQNSSRHLQLRSDAQHFSMMIQAASNYMDAEQNALLARLPIGPDFAAAPNSVELFPISPALPVSGQVLQNQGFLPAGVAVTVGRDQAVRLRIRGVKKPAPLTEWGLQALLISTAGQNYSDDEAGQVVSMAGAAAGFVRADDPTLIRGANGSWTSAVTDWPLVGGPQPTPGHLAALITGGLTGTVNANNYLHRTAHPQFNKMDTNIDMNRNELRNASVVRTDRIQSSLTSATASDVMIDPVGRLVMNPVESLVMSPGGNVDITPSGTDALVNILSPKVNLGSNSNVSSELNWSSRTSFVKFNDTGLTFRGGSVAMEVLGLTGRYELLFKSFLMKGDQRASLLLLGNLSLGGIGIADNWESRSDRRLKTNIKPISNALDKLSQLNGYTYNLKKNGKLDIGVIAQEVQKVFPEIVVRDDKGMLSVAYGNLVAPLIEAVKQLHQLILNLQDQFTNLLTTQTTQQTELDELKAQLKQQKLEFIQLKQAVHQPLTADERALCGAACEG